MAEIRIRGARTHNLRGIDVGLPLGGLTVVTGVSGSGKSSLAFDTVHAEGRRRYLEALSATDGGLRRPPVDAIDGLPPTLAFRQHARAPSRWETVGTWTEARAMLEVVFARAGVQLDPDTGEEIRPTPHDLIIKQLLERPEGARLTVEAPLLPSPGATLPGLLDELTRAGFSRIRTGGRMRRIDEVRRDIPVDPELRVVVDRIRVSAERRPRLAEALRTAGAAGRGVIVAVFEDEEIVYVDRPFSLSTGRTFPDLTPALFSRRGLGRCPTCQGSGDVDDAPCTACGGVGLREEARAVRWSGRSLRQLLAMPASALLGELEHADPDEIIADALAAVVQRLRALEILGLGHLPLARAAPDLSAGEWRRLRLARLLGSELSGVLYVLDEPSSGLGEGAASRVIEALDVLRERGNTLLVVSHREALVRRADRVIDLGPGAGVQGGTLLYAGSPEGLSGVSSPTGAWMAGALAPPTCVPDPGAGDITVPGAEHRFAVRGVTAITGPDGSGASTVLSTLARAAAAEALQGVEVPDRVLVVDEARTSSSRSLVATFVGAWDLLRELLAATTEARIRGLSAGDFSLATRGGRCEVCRGTGERRVDLGPLPPVFMPCEVCDGRRFQEDLLGVTWKAHSAADLLELEAVAAHRLLAGHPKLDRILRALVDVGLGYVPLGQHTRTLSGGEAARLRLARELGRTRAGVVGALILVDGPTDGLHPADARAVVTLLHHLAESGATVVAASHDPLVWQTAHQVIRLEGSPS